MSRIASRDTFLPAVFRNRSLIKHGQTTTWEKIGNQNDRDINTYSLPRVELHILISIKRMCSQTCEDYIIHQNDKMDGRRYSFLALNQRAGYDKCEDPEDRFRHTSEAAELAAMGLF